MKKYCTIKLACKVLAAIMPFGFVTTPQKPDEEPND